MQVIICIGGEIIEVIKRNRAQFNFSCSGYRRRYLLVLSLVDAVDTVHYGLRNSDYFSKENMLLISTFDRLQSM